jgi:hypothetical protein
MKMKLIITALTLLILSPFAFVQGQGISLERIEGGSLIAGEIVADGATPVYLYLRLTGSSSVCPGFTAGFKVYSGDGALWTAATVEALDVGTAWSTMFDSPGGLFLSHLSCSGTGEDTVGIGALAIEAGLLANFDEESFRIAIGPIASEHQGKTIALDSCFFGPVGHWMMAGGGSFDWDGPHTFDLVAMTDVPSYGGDLPGNFALGQNYPNPFNPDTEIRFELPTRAHVNISIYNLLGQRVRVLIDEERSAGYHTVTWDGRNSFGEGVSSGVYLYKMDTGNSVETKKMMLLK